MEHLELTEESHLSAANLSSTSSRSIILDTLASLPSVPLLGLSVGPFRGGGGNSMSSNSAASVLDASSSSLDQSNSILSPEKGGGRQLRTYPRISRDISDTLDYPSEYCDKKTLRLSRGMSGTRLHTIDQPIKRMSSIGSYLRGSMINRNHHSLIEEHHKENNHCSEIPLIRQVPGFEVERPTFNSSDIQYMKSEGLNRKKYLDHFYNKPHINFIGVDPQEGIVTISILSPEESMTLMKRKSRLFKKGKSLETFKSLSESDNPNKKNYQIKTRALIRNARGELDLNFQVKTQKYIKPKDLVKHLCAVYPPASLIKPRQLLSPDSRQLLLQYEESLNVSTYKFGVIYCKKGQISEEEMYTNEKGSTGFSQFLDLLGDKVELLNRSGWVGGLDTKENKDGTQSIYTQYHDNHIMFHVSTMLKHVSDDKQQIAKKRHIGNDVVVIIYQDDPISNDSIKNSFSPAFISSNYNHIFVLVRRLIKHPLGQGKVVYRVSVTARKGVVDYKPKLYTDVFEHGPEFRSWLLLKCINGEQASYHSDGFKSSRQRAQQAQLAKILSHHNTYMANLDTK